MPANVGFGVLQTSSVLLVQDLVTDACIVTPERPHGEDTESFQSVI